MTSFMVRLKRLPQCLIVEKAYQFTKPDMLSKKYIHLKAYKKQRQPNMYYKTIKV